MATAAGPSRVGSHDRNSAGGPTENRQSYRPISTAERLQGLVPDWYLSKDTDGDGQVAMQEFSQSWDAATLAEFVRVDVNGDGFITPRESRQAGKQRGVIARRQRDTAPARPRQALVAREKAKRNKSSRSASVTFTDPEASSPATQAMTKYISRFDQNGDGVLVQAERSKLPRDYSYADMDRDGRITAVEFVRALRSR